jgi:3-oxoacyl-[acyl-carrier-protein] synthase III
MEVLAMRRESQLPAVGISAISVYEPNWIVPNAWFGPTIAKKFVHHTGIEARPVSDRDEIAMAVRAVKQLRREVTCDLRDCAGLVFVSPSYIPLTVARKYFDDQGVKRESLSRAARKVARRLGIKGPALGMNWFCSGFAKAVSIVQRRLAVNLREDQFLLVVNANRISRITDYGCKQTGPLFGDMATATLIARTDSRKYPVRFEILSAGAERLAANGVFFDFAVRENVPTPQPDGGRVDLPRRVVFSLDGMGIADAAPRAMSGAVTKALQRSGIEPSDVKFVLPHQAGTGIIRLTAMKLEEGGIRGEVINGMTAKVGNVSSCSIPHALKAHWNRLAGTIACPTAAVGPPGAAKVSQGCILLKALPHDRSLARTG